MVYQYCKGNMKAVSSIQYKFTMKQHYILFCSLLFASLPVLAKAQNGYLDVPFATNLFDGIASPVNAVALQSDGKIVIGGQFTNIQGTSAHGIARLQPDGTVDDSFDAGAGTNQFIHDIAVLADGRILIGGEFTLFQGVGHRGLACVFPDGSPDPDFNEQTMMPAPGQCYAITPQTDGRILLGGDITSYNGTLVNNIVRIMPDGQLDPSFSCTTNGDVLAIAVQSDGKILLGGDFTFCDGVARRRLARVNADGSLDGSFDIGDGFTTTLLQYYIVKTITVQPDGRILVGGRFTGFDGEGHGGLIRLDANGANDPSFDVGLGCYGRSQRVGKFIPMPNDDLFVIGDYSGINTNYVLDDCTMLDPNGSNVPFGNPDYHFLSGLIDDAVLQPDGKLIVVGEFNFFDDLNGLVMYNIVRFLTDFSTHVEQSSARQVVIAPNPTSGSFRLTGLPGSNYTVEVRSADGRVVRVLQTVPERPVDIQDLSAGSYLITARDRDGGFVASGRLLKE